MDETSIPIEDLIRIFADGASLPLLVWIIYQQIRLVEKQMQRVHDRLDDICYQLSVPGRDITKR